MDTAPASSTSTSTPTPNERAERRRRRGRGATPLATLHAARDRALALVTVPATPSTARGYGP